MKKFLLFGAVLMVGASIYGFVDYSKTKQTKEFSKMYDEPVIKNAEEITTKDEPVISKEEIVAEKKEAVKNSNVSKPAFVKKPVKRKIQKPRKVNYKSFSRAPLREEVVIELKTEPRKAVVKEQQ
jgi:hypothetical protein